MTYCNEERDVNNYVTFIFIQNILAHRGQMMELAGQNMLGK